MDSAEAELRLTCRELVNRYDNWRRIYRLADETPRDEPMWEDGCLHLRTGYPNPGWTGYIVEPERGGCSVRKVTSERRNDPIESLCGFFSSVEDAGKYILFNVAESLRISLGLEPIQWAWEEARLDPRVQQISVGQYESRFELKDDPTRYFVLQVGSVQPESKLLTLSYDELDSLLLDGMPESLLAQL